MHQRNRKPWPVYVGVILRGTRTSDMAVRGLAQRNVRLANGEYIIINHLPITQASIFSHGCLEWVSGIQFAEMLTVNAFPLSACPCSPQEMGSIIPLSLNLTGLITLLNQQKMAEVALFQFQT